MVFVEAMMTVGLCLIVGAAGFLLGMALKAARRGSRQDVTEQDYPGLRLDVLMSVVWGGMLLVQIGNILLHQDPSGMYRLSPLTLVATGGEIFVCGVFTGRLLLRRQMRWYEAKREEESRASRA